MKKSRILTGVLSLVMVFSMVIPAFAVDVDTDGGTGSVPVELTAEAATFSVTVPTALPINVAADGTVTTANDAKIINNSHGAVKVTNMTIAGQNSWVVIHYDSANMAAEKVDSKKVAMTINGDKTTGADAITFTESNFPKMDGANAADTDELAITYDAKVPAQATELSNVTVSNVVFTIGWDTVA